MRADPTDRIMPVDGPEISPVSVPRIFAVSLALPFAHPIRLILSSIVPVALIAAMGLGPLQRVLALWQAFYTQDIVVRTDTTTGTTTSTMTTTTPPPALPTDIIGDILKVEGVLFLALALGLCAWQRAAARDFAEPIPRWLGRSLLHLPGYILALVVWTLAPALVLIIPFAVMLGLIALNMGAGWALPAAQVADEMMAIPAMLSDLQWWVLAVATVTVTLIALWLSARLSPLPALVARQGWRRALGRAWRLSHGHGFGLSVSFLGYALLAFAIMVIAGIAFGVIMASHIDGVPDPGTVIAFSGIINLVGAALIAIWQGSLGALVVRDGLTPAEALDPTMFD